MMEEKQIVIVGGGICGLGTALALHRKGIKSIVIEKAASLRTKGGGLSIQQNGWRALDQLGVGHLLRPKGIPLLSGRIMSLYNGSQLQEESYSDVEYRCIKRGDLINSLATNLPSDTIRLGCEIAKVESDPITSHTILHLQDGTVIKAKVVIGCDGINSVVGDWLNLKPTKRYNISGVEGFTNYPDGHGFGNEFVRVRGDNMFLGRIPILEKQVYWFAARLWNPQDTMISKEPKLLRDSTLELIKDFPKASQVVKKCDLDSITLNSLRHRAPWDLLVERFRKGTVTVAGDAMHAMAPFAGQGAAAALEDAVVLGRCLAKEMAMNLMAPELDSERSDKDSWEWKKRHDEEEKAMLKRIEKAIDRYVKERRMRIRGYRQRLISLQHDWKANHWSPSSLFPLFFSSSTPSLQTTIIMTVAAFKIISKLAYELTIFSYNGFNNELGKPLTDSVSSLMHFPIEEINRVDRLLLSWTDVEVALRKKMKRLTFQEKKRMSLTFSLRNLCNFYEEAFEFKNLATNIEIFKSPLEVSLC